MQELIEITGKIAAFIWGTPLLVLLGGTGLYLTIGLRGIQFRKTLHGFELLFKSGKGKVQGDISPFQALTTALSATVGTGNIAGVATAIFAGGPGALLWMWVMGLVGMATKFSEIYLSLQYRHKGEDGKMMGGPMYYIEKGLGSKKLAVAFAVCCLAASLGSGNMVQSHSIAVAVTEMAPWIPKWVIGLVSASLVALVILGGIERIGKVTEKLVPLMAGIYVIGAVAILILYWQEAADAIGLVFDSAFSGAAAAGGFMGATVKSAIQYGVARGTFSNEAGLGSAPIAHAAAKIDKPAKQALIGMIGTFIDTLVICTMTGLVILSTGVWQSGTNGAALTIEAFNKGLPGHNGGLMIVSVGLVLFAFTTFLGWSYYGLQCVEYLWGLKAAKPYRLIFVAVIVLGAQLKLSLVWNIVDILVAFMAIPNLLALLGMSRMLFKVAHSDPDLK